MLFPKPLFEGARVALVAPSGPQPPEKLKAAVKSVKELGLEPVVFPSCEMEHGYLAGPDSQRARDIQAAFADESIDGILCIRGGYGAHRLMPLLNFDAIRKTPKPLYGYSDITALHIQLQQQCGFVSWHTPMPGTEWHKGLDDYTLQCLKAALFGPVPKGIHNPPGIPFETLCPGEATGRLWGGNLSLVAATLGTPYEIDTRDKILFLEDVDEEPYCIDRMLVQLKHSGKLAACAGILLGPFTNCEGGKKEKKTLTVPEILAELLVDEGKPILQNLQCGHTLPTTSLPLGALVRMDAGAGTLEILEAGK